ncbi:MAG TPA: hypothetical protein VFV52_16355 [Bacilli bacterium]|nr:hypothetical protein [Bacilli bacterium]
MSFELTGWMLYTMWAVLGLMGLDILVGLYRSLMSNTFSLSKLPGFLTGVLTYVLPLFILANLTDIEPTGWLVTIGYYVGGIGVIVKYLMDIKSKL